MSDEHPGLMWLALFGVLLSVLGAVMSILEAM